MAGIHGFGVLTAIAMWSRKPVPARATTNLHVGGLGAHEPGLVSSDLTWMNRDLRLGDVVTIRVVRRRSCDTPRYEREAPGPSLTEKRAMARRLRAALKRLDREISASAEE